MYMSLYACTLVVYTLVFFKVYNEHISVNLNKNTGFMTFTKTFSKAKFLLSKNIYRIIPLLRVFL